MFKHIVLIKFKPDSQDKLKEAEAKFYQLATKISEIKKLVVGLDEVHTTNSYDLVANLDFNSKADWEIYDKHPEHQPVRAFILENKLASVVIDYTFEDHITI